MRCRSTSMPRIKRLTTLNAMPVAKAHYPRCGLSGRPPVLLSRAQHPPGEGRHNAWPIRYFSVALLCSRALYAAIGNLIENVMWRLFGGMPTDWVTKTGEITLLSPQQIEAVEAKVRSRLN